MENLNATPNTQVPMNEEGYLLLRVGTAGGALPIAGADVRIEGHDQENQALIYLLTSDENGNIQKIALPAPPKALSQTPTNAAESFATYDVTVFKSGFYTQRILSLPIFSTITSTQFVELIPFSAYEPMQNPPTSELVTVEKTPFSKGESF